MYTRHYSMFSLRKAEQLIVFILATFLYGFSCMVTRCLNWNVNSFEGKVDLFFYQYEHHVLVFFLVFSGHTYPILGPLVPLF